MSGTLEGGKATAAKLKAEDPNYYVKLGMIGGKAKVKKGFATATAAQRSEWGRKGGLKSRKNKEELV